MTVTAQVCLIPLLYLKLAPGHKIRLPGHGRDEYRATSPSVSDVRHDSFYVINMWDRSRLWPVGRLATDPDLMHSTCIGNQLTDRHLIVVTEMQVLCALKLF
jgi:hypothetical protein